MSRALERPLVTGAHAVVHARTGRVQTAMLWALPGAACEVLGRWDVPPAALDTSDWEARANRT